MRRAASVVCSVEAALLVALAGFYLYELGIGASEDATRVVMSVALFLVVALGLAAMALALRRGRSWPGTPILVLNLLLLPTAWTLVTSGHVAIGAGVGVLAVAGVVSGWGSRETRADVVH